VVVTWFFYFYFLKNNFLFLKILKLYHERFSTDPNLLNSFASSICISNCGNFVLIGYSSGHVDVFNMQSGKYKFSLESKKFLEEEKSKTTTTKNVNSNKNTRAHDSLVAGIALDILNRNVVTGSADGKIYFWKFGNPSILRSIMKVASGVQLFRLDLLNSLLAVGLANGEVGIVDILCRFFFVFSVFFCNLHDFSLLHFFLISRDPTEVS